jgi:plasmid stability protein
MNTTQKRATIYLDSRLHRALRLRAAESDSSISALVNEAVRLSLLEDGEDIEAFSRRAAEPRTSFGNVVRDLKRRARL